MCDESLNFINVLFFRVMIWPKFELIRDIVVILVTCNFINVLFLRAMNYIFYMHINSDWF